MQAHYGCHSSVIARPPAGTFYRAQTGWTTDERRKMVDVGVLPSVVHCGYKEGSRDRRCDACEWIPL